MAAYPRQPAPKRPKPGVQWGFRATFAQCKGERLRIDWARATFSGAFLIGGGNFVAVKFSNAELAPMYGAAARFTVAAVIFELLAGVSAAGVRKSLFALRSMLDAAVADRRLSVNHDALVPLPAERASEQRFATGEEVATLAGVIAPRYRALVLLGAYGGLRWGELAGLRRARVDTLRSRVTIVEAAIDVSGKITLGEPKTAKSRRVVPIAGSIMREIATRLAEHFGPEPGALRPPARRPRR